jgi:hypothetical protein
MTLKIKVLFLLNSLILPPFYSEASFWLLYITDKKWYLTYLWLHDKMPPPPSRTETADWGNLDKVIKLGDANNKTLGFFSKGHFSRFRHQKNKSLLLWIIKRGNSLISFIYVLNQAKGNLDQEIMAFRFSKTEVFNHPIQQHHSSFKYGYSICD